ncbi:MAG TPA: GNAT family protein [Gemmatimonadales bacterium]|jgi:RimJ/RimL family protein N-acetyltransferase|nr:GNAT family protein [Gemmatimonadales bacterium]
MKLLPLDTTERLELVGRWLGKEENYKWLDFGNGVQALAPAMLRIMTQRGLHVLHIYTAGPEDEPAGVVGLSNVDRKFKTATLWAVLGNKRYGGCTREACARLVTLGFTELGLSAINAWTVEINVAARRVLESLGFTYLGRQRRCHYIDGRPYDRLLFDLLADEQPPAMRQEP